MMHAPNPVLEVRELRTVLDTSAGLVRAVDGISLSVGPGEVVGLVGESGCGKSMTALSIMRLIPSPPARIIGGSALLRDGVDMLTLNGEELRRRRGAEIAMMFQDPSAYLNPVMRIGHQIREGMLLHGRPSDDHAVAKLLAAVGLPRDVRIEDRYPHELSGGMQQRALLAVAVACDPALLLADEPTTALDVTVQAHILALLRKLCDESGTAILLITHDFAVVAEVCDRIYVMYAGQIVEEGDVQTIFERPAHPYTRALLAAARALHGTAETLQAIEGTVPDLRNLPSGCRFAPRCPFVRDVCKRDPPYMPSNGIEVHLALCWIGTKEYETSPGISHRHPDAMKETP